MYCVMYDQKETVGCEISQRSVCAVERLVVLGINAVLFGILHGVVGCGNGDIFIYVSCECFRVLLRLMLLFIVYSNVAIVSTVTFELLNRPLFVLVKPTLPTDWPCTLCLKVVVADDYIKELTGPVSLTTSLASFDKEQSSPQVFLSEVIRTTWESCAPSFATTQSREDSFQPVELVPIPLSLSTKLAQLNAIEVSVSVEFIDGIQARENSALEGELQMALEGELICLNTTAVVSLYERHACMVRITSVTVDATVIPSSIKIEESRLLAKSIGWHDEDYGETVPPVGFVNALTRIKVTVDKSQEKVEVSTLGMRDSFTWIVGVLSAGKKRIVPRSVCITGSSRFDMDLLVEQLDDWCCGQGTRTRVLSTAMLLLEAEGRDHMDLEEELRLHSMKGIDVVTEREVHGRVVVFVEDIGLLAWTEESLNSRQRLVRESLRRLVRSANEGDNGSRDEIVVIATCREDLKRSLQALGFEQELVLEFPTKADREEVIRGVLARHIPSDSMQWLATVTNGYSRGDLRSLCSACLNHPSLSPTDALRHALGYAASQSPSSSSFTTSSTSPWPFEITRASFSSSDNDGQKWSGVGGYNPVKARLEQLLRWQCDARLGQSLGIMLHGPSGCGKTMLCESLQRVFPGLAWICVKADEIASKYLGESERLIRQLFTIARRHVPCVVFIDELDAITAKRDLHGSGGTVSGVEARVLSTLLNEMDGVENGGSSGNTQMTVIAATNRLDAIDPALLRPGRFGHCIRVGKPSQEERLSILEAQTLHMALAKDVDLTDISKRTCDFTPADLKEVVSDAALRAFREHLRSGLEQVNSAIMVEMRNFNEALDQPRDATVDDVLDRLSKQKLHLKF